jgi:hypothetical protein
VAKIRRVRADVLEPRIWGFVSGLLLEPGRLRRGLEAMIEEEERANRGGPEREAKLWHDKLQEAERMRSGYQDLAAKGLLTYEELGEKLAALEETRATARRELEALKGRRERLEDLKRDRDAPLIGGSLYVPSVTRESTRRCSCALFRDRHLARSAPARRTALGRRWRRRISSRRLLQAGRAGAGPPIPLAPISRASRASPLLDLDSIGAPS